MPPKKIKKVKAVSKYEEMAKMIESLEYRAWKASHDAIDKLLLETFQGATIKKQK